MKLNSLKALGTSIFLMASTLIGAPLTLNHEGMELAPYYDSVGVKTVCGGETQYVEDRLYSKDECKKLYGIRYGWYSLKTLAMYNDKAKEIVTPEIHAAVTDLSYNIGPGKVKDSEIIRYLNAGRPYEACKAILNYKKAGPFLDCSKTKGMKKGCYGVWDRRLRMSKLCLKGI